MKTRNIGRTVKSVVARECGMGIKSINNNTSFMANQNISYFDCMCAMFTLQHKFHVSLPESDYDKYKTVGCLIKNITKQLKENQK